MLPRADTSEAVGNVSTSIASSSSLSFFIRISFREGPGAHVAEDRMHQLNQSGASEGGAWGDPNHTNEAPPPRRGRGARRRFDRVEMRGVEPLTSAVRLQR